MKKITKILKHLLIICSLFVVVGCDNQDPEPQVLEGVKYDLGNGVPEDDIEAVKLYRLAADQGDANAQFNLGVMYAKGQGVPEDDKEAIRWYRLAARQGHADAEQNLAVIDELEPLGPWRTSHPS